ncbi:hypothetical protein [Mesorhizobium sp.]|uniref:hypothetical protein n=1 Tax=Mesorhizobium sp. TaxID=1871066 RepID=UPI00257F399B|nr:hypothetical protein [Mesorhizobium sp.]
MDIHRTFAEVVVWEDGRLRHHGGVDMTRSGLKGVGRSLRRMAVVRVLSPYFGRVIVANPMQVKAIAHARYQDRQDRCRRSGAAPCQRLSA